MAKLYKPQSAISVAQARKNEETLRQYEALPFEDRMKVKAFYQGGSLPVFTALSEGLGLLAMELL